MRAEATACLKGQKAERIKCLKATPNERAKTLGTQLGSGDLDEMSSELDKEQRIASR
jgi:hypothetical protein